MSHFLAISVAGLFADAVSIKLHVVTTCDSPAKVAPPRFGKRHGTALESGAADRVLSEY